MKAWLAGEKDLWNRYSAKAHVPSGAVPNWALFFDFCLLRAIASINEKWSQAYGDTAARTYAQARGNGAVPGIELAWRGISVLALAILTSWFAGRVMQHPFMIIGAFAFSWWCFRWVIKDIRAEKNPPSGADLSSLPRSGRALKDQIGRWPKVTHAGNGGYLITATFTSPSRAGWPTKIAVAAAAVIFLFALDHLAQILPGNRDNEGLRMVAVLIGSMIAAWVTRPIWVFLCRVRLEIRVQQGGATWTGPRRARCRIKPDDDYEGIARPHHLGPEEIRVQNENIRRRVTKEKEKTKPAYQVSSEVLFRTGWSKHIEMPVAEIMPDISGRKAAALKAALDLALHESRKAVARAKAERMAAGGRSSNNRRTDFDDE